MIRIYVLPLMFFAIAAVQATTVNLSGVVKSSKTNAAVSGADVKLKKLGMSTTTNSEGAFSFTKTAIDLIAKETRVVRDGNLNFRLENDGNVCIRISDLSGRVHSRLSYDKLQRGTWRLVPPSLNPGMYVCTFKTDKEHISVRYFVSKKCATVSNGTVHADGNDVSRGATMTLEKMQASNITDTVVVSKSGYKTAQYVLTTYSKTDLNIALEEESVNSDDATIVPDQSWTCYMA
ncbi:MAG TPA: hypothetical protein VHO70_18645, partial [Chitinispirillaceae bacterium]|nr:hypothetical protein [Chitinispirillaceae bacterium]